MPTFETLYQPILVSSGDVVASMDSRLSLAVFALFLPPVITLTSMKEG
jgi:hypothetical protein